jgi:hypothetical protein
MKIVIYLLGFACIAYCTYFNLYTRQAANSLKNMFQTYQLIWLNICQQKNLSIPKKKGLMIFIERLDRGGVCNNDGRAL